MADQSILGQYMSENQDNSDTTQSPIGAYMANESNQKVLPAAEQNLLTGPTNSSPLPAQTDPWGLIQKYFPQDQWDNAYQVMMAESGGFPGAVGDKNIIPGDISEKVGQPFPSYGLFQIRGLPGRPDPTQLVNPDFNVAYAANLYKNQGWHPWSTAVKMGLAN